MSLAGAGVFLLTVVIVALVVLDRLRAPFNAPIPDLQSNPATVRSVTSSATKRELLAGRRTMVAGALAFGLLLLVIGQVGLIGGAPNLGPVILWLAGLAIIVWLDWPIGGEPAKRRNVREAAGFATDIARWRLMLLLPIGLAALYMWTETPSRPIDDSSLDLVFLWLLSIVAFVVAAGVLPDRFPAIGLRARLVEHRLEVAIATAVLLVAIIPRAWSLSTYAWSMSGDEGTFAVTARSTLEGAIRNPFSSGPWGYPSLLFIVQGWFIDLFGGSVGSARALSALFGVCSVVTVWLLIRDHFSRNIALLAALFCASLNLHVYWSRDAQNASAPMFFLPLAILLLDRGLIGGSRTSSVGAGLIIALAQFFHPSNRLLLPMAIAYLIYALILVSRDKREISLQSWGSTLANAGWLTAAIVIGHLPLIAYFEAHRHEFWSRTNEVSVFASGWLDREQIITGDSALEIMARQIWNAIMFPFSTEPHGHYRPGSPLVGWPLVIFVAIGLALATVWLLRRRYFGIALGFWVVTIGLGFTDGPPMTNRYTAAAPFLAMLGAVGLWAAGRVIVLYWRVPVRYLAPAVGTIAILIAIWQFHFYFQDPNQVDLYSDANSQLANGVAREAEKLGDGAVVYLAGAPRLTYSGFMNIAFIAPNAIGFDVDPMWDLHQSPPQLVGPTLFAFIPERSNELEVVSSWFPDGSLTLHTSPDGSTLYLSYLVIPDVASKRWPTD